MVKFDQVPIIEPKNKSIIVHQPDTITGRATQGEFNGEDVVEIRSEAEFLELFPGGIMPASKSTILLFKKLFDMSVPILLDDLAGLVINGNSASCPNYTGPAGTAFIRNLDPAKPFVEVQFLGNFVDGNSDTVLFDLVGDPAFSSIAMINSSPRGFKDLGKVKGATIVVRDSAPQVSDGLFAEDCLLSIDNIRWPPSPLLPNVGGTLFKCKNSSVNTSKTDFRTRAGEAAYFIDPNSTVQHVIFNNKNDSTGELLRVTGSSGAVTAVTDVGGLTRFVAANTLVANQLVVLGDSFTNAAYKNKTVIITSRTSTTFDTALAFAGNDTGDFADFGLDETSVFVTSLENNTIPNSMTQGEGFVAAAGVEVQSSATFVPVEDITSSPGDWIANSENEEIELNTTTGGQKYIGLKTRTLYTKYHYEATVSGPSQIITVAVFKDAGAGFIEVPRTRRSIDTAVSNIIDFIGTFTQTKTNDEFKLFENNDGGNNVNVLDPTILQILRSGG